MSKRKLREAPAPADAHYARALALWDGGRAREAADAIDSALRARPDFAEALSMGAYILETNGKPEAALRFYLKAVERKPELAVAWSNLGKLLFRFSKYAEALAAFDAGLAAAPLDADLLNSRAGALSKLGRLEESEAAARLALRQRPDFAEAALNLGTAALKRARPEEALAAYRGALRARPDWAEALNGEALALRALGRIEEARSSFDRAVALGSREAISGRGCVDLMLGDFERGWEGYEARWIDGKSLAEALGARFPLWRGPGDPARRVLVLNDHGLGDTLQFCRYLPLMARAGAEATFVCPAKLHRLLASSLDVRLAASIPEGERFDAQIAVSSLPRAFATRIDSIPASVPYLSPEPARIANWSHRIGPDGFRIGLVWQGNPDPEADMARSYPLRAAEPLAKIAGVRLIALQKGFGEEQLAELPASLRVETLGADYDSGPDAFVDAAAAMAGLDLVVTCDTSMAHLAGALGRPVWVALKNDAEWRWLRDREDSPWYPTMRLFRQPAIGDWGAVFSAMAKALNARLNP